VSAITPRIATVLLCVAGFGLASLPAPAATTEIKRDLSKDFDDLTPSEQIAIRAAAKAAYKQKKLKELKVCADPGNMPLSDIKGEGFQNKMAEVLGEAMGAQVSFNWRPFIERGLTRQTFDQDMCDVLMDMPANYGPMLTTFPIYKTPYVLVYRNDKGLKLTGLDDPKLKDLKIGVFETSALRAALAKRGIVDNITLQVPSHDGDLVPEHQPWHIIQDVTDGKLDVAGVFGPFAGWRVAQKHEPLTILPVNLDDDTIPLEFDLGIGVRKTDAFLKYMLEFALDDKKDEIEKILHDYGVPLVQCSKCLVQGDLPAHGSYIAVNQQDFKVRPDLASPDQVVTEKKVEQWLAEGADITQELSNAVNADDHERIKFLVSKGADVNKPDSNGYTPLTNAARQRQDKTVKLLIDLGANPNLADGNNMTPIITAAMREAVPTIKVLVGAKANIEEPGPQGFKPLSLALAESHYEAAKTLLEAGADPNATSGDEALTPLMIAASQTQPAEGERFLPGSTRPIDVAKELVDRKADVNAKSSTGMTALMIAAAHNNPPMIGLLIESGADADAKNDQGQSAADIAKINNNFEAAQAIKVLATAKAAEATPASDPKSTSQ
jgi:quinoprotein dehydrogenase-associated probable ABC transporter substrate-binding protein